MRTIWNGSLSFGLVTIPVGLAPATTPKARSSDVSFRTLHRECKTPIKQKRWCPTHEREVSNDEIVKGWEVSKGQFVIVEETEVNEPELQLARQLIDGLVGEFEPEELDSEYRQNLRELLEAKLKGEEISVPEPVSEAPAIDLMEALKKSVAATKSRSAAGDGDKPAASKKAAPRKRAAAR